MKILVEVDFMFPLDIISYGLRTHGMGFARNIADSGDLQWKQRKEINSKAF